NMVAAFHMFVETVFWFHPVVWWIGTRLLEERERACDEGVLSTGSEPRLYAEAVLSVCKLCVETPLECVSGIAGGNLKGRIEAIMPKQTPHIWNLEKNPAPALAPLPNFWAQALRGMRPPPAALAQAGAPPPLPAPVAVAAQVPAEKPHPRNTPP